MVQIYFERAVHSCGDKRARKKKRERERNKTPSPFLFNTSAALSLSASGSREQRHSGAALIQGTKGETNGTPTVKHLNPVVLSTIQSLIYTHTPHLAP